MKTDTSKKIIEFIENNKTTTAKDIIAYFGFTPAAIHRHLDKLIGKGELKKVGKPPKVFYTINKEGDRKLDTAIDKNTKNIIEENFLRITPAGEKKEGWDGFEYWCKEINEKVEKTAEEYIKTLKKYDAYKKDGLIDGYNKFKETFKDSINFDKIYYFDFYSIERFGKTKLGQELLYGKQNGNKELIKDIVSKIKPEIIKLIKKYEIDGVGYIPWTIDRKVQFMRELEKGLNLNIKTISIEKIRNEITVAQKTLPKIKDRVENARENMIVTEKGKYKKILLIDDAVGSGATLNEVAKQIKEKGVAKKVIGLAITGSFKGFDVISEV